MQETITDDPVAAAVALIPQVLAARDEAEAGRRLPPKLAEALDQAGMLRLGLPRSMGGQETDPITSFRAIEEISKADGSVGWCCLIASGTSIMTGRLRPEVGRSMFGQPPNVRISGSARPEGEARPVDGGYMVQGHWDYASGIDHANWLLCTCKIMDGDGPRMTPSGALVTRSMLVPVEDAKILDTWTVVGMCGTGSKDFVVEDVFVPEERSFSRNDPPQESGPLYHPRLMYVATWINNAANALGIARGAMDAFVELAAETGSTASTTPLRDRLPVQLTVAEAEAIISSARAYVMESIGNAWTALCEGVPDPSREIAHARIANAYAVREAVRAVDLLFHAAGTNAIHRKHPLERCFRDIHVAVQHGAALPLNYEFGGQVLLGLRPTEIGW